MSVLTSPRNSLAPGAADGARHDGSLHLRIQPIWLGVFLSLLLHGLALWQWRPEPDLRLREPAERGETRLPLRAQLRMSERAAPPSVQPPAPPAAPRIRRRAVPPSRPPVMALNVPAPAPAVPASPLMTPGPEAPPSPPRAPVAPAAPAAPTIQGDFSAMLDARRRARGEAPSPPVESEAERRDRIVASNLGQDARALSIDPRRGGGMFQIQRLGYDRAEFLFYGWNKDIRRNSSQLIEVRKGDNPDIRIAVARRMIAIIREHEQGDFEWRSYRLGRVVTLSARREDNAGLEEFMLREFFSGG